MVLVVVSGVAILINIICSAAGQQSQSQRGFPVKLIAVIVISSTLNS